VLHLGALLSGSQFFYCIVITSFLSKLNDDAGDDLKVTWWLNMHEMVPRRIVCLSCSPDETEPCKLNETWSLVSLALWVVSGLYVMLSVLSECDETLTDHYLGNRANRCNYGCTVRSFL